MRKIFSLMVGLILAGASVLGTTTVSIVSSSVANNTPTIAVPINLSNTDTVGGLQFSIKDLPNQLNLVGVSAYGRIAAEPYDDVGNGVPGTAGNGQYDVGEPFQDLNGNGEWDGAFNVEFNDRDTSVSVLIFDASGRSIPPGDEPIAYIIYSIPNTVQDAIINLRFHEILNTDPQFLLVVTDPYGNAMPTNWMDGQVTVGGVAVYFSGPAYGSPGTTATLHIAMNNASPVKGFQFNIVDAPAVVSLESISGIGRAASFNVAANEVNGQTRVLGVDFNGNEIPPGDGDIIELVLTIDGGVSVGDSVAVDIQNLIVAAQGGVAVPSYGIGGVIRVVTDVAQEAEIPTSYDLSQNFPNPFNPSTSITFMVPTKDHVRLSVYNLLGQEVKVLVDKELPAGTYSARWEGTDAQGNRLVSGVYFYRMVTKSGYTATRKMILLK